MTTAKAKEHEREHWKALSIALDVPVDELKKLSLEEIDELVAKKVGKPSFARVMRGILSRGNPLLAMGRFIDHAKLMRRFEKEFG